METFLADLDKFPLRRLTLCGVPYDGLWHLKLKRVGILPSKRFKTLKVRLQVPRLQ
jgi:hypothetical protein